MPSTNSTRSVRLHHRMFSAQRAEFLPYRRLQNSKRYPLSADRSHHPEHPRGGLTVAGGLFVRPSFVRRRLSRI